jgi:hypothetical protein
MGFHDSMMKPESRLPIDCGRKDDIDGYNAYPILTKGNSLVINIV